MRAATGYRSPHRRDAPAYLSTVEDLITYLWTGEGPRLGAAVALELGPDASKRKELPVLIECYP